MKRRKKYIYLLSLMLMMTSMPTQLFAAKVDTQHIEQKKEQKNNEVKDTDKDGLPDILEKEIGTLINNPDTDKDGLPDGYEVFTIWTNPALADTDNNGIKDGDEDIDEDGLKNIQEFKLGTSPSIKDTDHDDLTDYEEVYKYHTDPLKADTDKDDLEDGDEILLGFNPLKADTDKDGILDKDEKVLQTYETALSEPDVPAITKVSVTFAGNGNISKTTRINNMYNIDMLSTNVVGIVGGLVEINTLSDFDNLTLTFTYDQTRLGKTNEKDLCIMWYDEEKQWYEILDEDSVVDPKKKTISVKTSHLGTYLIVNRLEWYKAWQKPIDYRNSMHKTYL